MPHPGLITQSERTAKDITELSPLEWSAFGYVASNVRVN